MLVPINWLRDYVKVEGISMSELARKMALSGSNVEEVISRDLGFSGVVSACIEEIRPHPDSDHMWVTTVNDGSSERTQVVCGAQNLTKGDIVPFAKVGAILPGDKKISEAKLRGIESYGMLCSGQELGMNSSIIPKDSLEGILLLPKETPLGVDIKEILGLDDTLIDFELTNNRQDCNSILGMAAETAATLGSRFEYPPYEFERLGSDINDYLSVEVKDFEACRRYSARMVKVLKIEPSPLWMQVRLMSVGIRPINNIVDVSNFVMVEIGQPLHTFDYAQIQGKKIIVQKAQPGDNIITLDGNTRPLNGNVLMISDTVRHIGVAGIMGGENSEITDKTEYVVIESANFEKNSIRASSKFFGLRSESSAHFEKGISIHLTKYALDRAASLLVEIGACEYIDGLIDVYKELPEPKVVSVATDDINKLLATSISTDEAAGYLNLLGFGIETSGEVITATTPRFRQDINIKEDLIEEVARIYGYDKIGTSLPSVVSSLEEENKHYASLQALKKFMLAIGGYEMLTYSFISPRAQEALAFEDTDLRSKTAIIINPLGEDYSVMRTSLLTGLLDALALNQRKKNESALMFEIAPVYLPDQSDEGLPYQPNRLVFGKFDSDYYDLKAIVDNLVQQLQLDGITFVRSTEKTLHPGKSADVYLDETKLGFIGILHPSVAAKYGLENVGVGEFDAEALGELLTKLVYTSPVIAKFPAVTRDLALVAEDKVLSDEIRKVIRENSGAYLKRCEVFDVYKSDAIGIGKKSIAYSLEFQSDTETLTDEEIDTVIKNILNSLESELQVRIRE
jgi:phenylalanyl-tRNA synthetase beta chain